MSGPAYHVMFICACLAVLAGCRDTTDSIPLDVLAVRLFDEGRQGREFTVLEPVVIDTGIVATQGTLRFAVQFDSDANEEGVVAVLVGHRAVYSCAVPAIDEWHECVVELPGDVPTAPVELAIDVAGRYRLASLELVDSDGG